MPEFPPEERLLGELVRHRPYTIEAQNALAKFLVAFARDHDLGEARLVQFPADCVYGNHDPPRYNVAIDTPCTVGEPTETTGLYGHFDIVPPSKGYRDEQLGQLTRDVHNRHLWYGHGAGDMLMATVSYLLALRDIAYGKHRMWARRSLRTILTCGEEAYSEGFGAAWQSGLFDGVGHVITGEILTSEHKLDPAKRILIEGRPGRYGFTVIAHAPEMHVGAVTNRNRDSLADRLDRLIKDTIDELNDVLHENPDRTGGLTLAPRALPLRWEATGEASLTTAQRVVVDVVVHSALHANTPEKAMAWTRNRLIDRAIPIFGEEIAMRLFDIQLEVHGPDVHSTTPFSEPWKENHHHRLLRKMREEIMPMANADCDNRRYDNDKPDGVKSVLDGGVADCNLIANHGIPVAGIAPPVWGAHTANERVDIRGIEYTKHVILRAVEREEVLSPPDKSL